MIPPAIEAASTSHRSEIRFSPSVPTTLIKRCHSVAVAFQSKSGGSGAAVPGTGLLSGISNCCADHLLGDSGFSHKQLRPKGGGCRAGRQAPGLGSMARFGEPKRGVGSTVGTRCRNLVAVSPLSCRARLVGCAKIFRRLSLRSGNSSLVGRQALNPRLIAGRYS
jgi:hypothetical protein